MKLIKKIIKVAIFYRQYQRFKIILGYYEIKFRTMLKWIFSKTETDNFYYSLEEINLRDLGSVISIVTGEEPKVIQAYFDEIIRNAEIQLRISHSWRENQMMKDASTGLARRIGWYAVIRSAKPKLVVETGVSHGVGSLVICAALEKNTREGFRGSYIGTDINPDAGSLLLDRFREFADILVGDSLTSLTKLSTSVDVFINDSDHSPEYEAREYIAIESLLSKNSIILGDNSHVTNELREFSYSRGRKYVFFSEKPKDHWYPGAGIGFSFR